jgi:hypothetical protein
LWTVATAFVISKNHRRHDESQRAMVAGDDEAGSAKLRNVQEDAAAMLNVSRRSGSGAWRS